MASPHADLASDEPRPRWRWELWVIIFLILLALILPAIPLRHVDAEIDLVTGSVTTRTVGWFGFVTRVTEDVSPLEVWLKQRGETWTPDWRLWHSNTHYLFGSRHGFGGEHTDYLLLNGMQDVFIAATTEQEILTFVRDMERGTEDERSVTKGALWKKWYETKGIHTGRRWLLVTPQEPPKEEQESRSP